VENEIIKSENEELKARLTKIEQMQDILMKEINQIKTVNK
jgi:hypothetical protein